MLASDPPIFGFTTWTAEGHGFGFGSASISERVRGRVKRSVIVAILQKDAVIVLLSNIIETAAMPHLTYWTESVLAFGQLQRGKPAPANVVYLNDKPDISGEDK